MEERIPIEVRDASHGTLTVRRAHPSSGEDVATLKILALQAAVAARLHRLLGADRFLDAFGL